MTCSERISSESFDQLSEGWHGPTQNGEHLHVGRNTSKIEPPWPYLQSGQYTSRTVYGRPNDGAEFIILRFEEEWRRTPFAERVSLGDVWETVVVIYRPTKHCVWYAATSPKAVMELTTPDDCQIGMISSSDEEAGDSKLTRKQRRALAKEIPWHRIPYEQRSDYEAAEQKEWDEWLKWESVRILSSAASQEIMNDPVRKKRILPGRFCYRDKGHGMEENVFSPKARLVAQGFRDPDRHRLRRDSPTATRLGVLLLRFR